MPSPTILRLALANFIARRTRFALTIAAVAMSVALVVGITSGYASLERALRAFVEDFIGPVDFEVTRGDDARPAIPPSVVAELRADPRVRNLTQRIEVSATPIGEDGRPLDARLLIFGVEADPASLGRTPRMDQGRFLLPGERDAIVVDGNALEAMQKKVGDKLTFGAKGEPLTLRIVGVIHKPAAIKMFFKSAYVNLERLGQFAAPDRPDHVTKLRGEFNTEVDAAAFVNDWKQRLATHHQAYKLTLLRESREELDRNLLSVRLASYLGSTISLASAAFIILATLMTGVQEQRRQLAMLRAVGATRWQVARLVGLEGLAIGLTGALVGIPLGIGGLYLLAMIYPDVFEGGVTLAVSGIVYAIVVAALAALLASIFPALAAARARPVEAMSAATDDDRSGRLPWLWISIGAALIAIDSLIIFTPFDRLLTSVGADAMAQHARGLKVAGHILIGLPTMLLGALLFAPLVVRGVEWLGTLALPGMLRLPSALLRQQLTESPWRSAATGVAMMIGLMMLITMNSQGESALGAWKIPSRFPDVFILPEAGFGTIKPGEVDAIRGLPQVKAGRVMPIGVSAASLGMQLFDVAGPAMPSRTLFIGIDPAIGFDMMELDFRAGNEATAKRMMLAGRQLRLADGAVLQGTIERDEATGAETLRQLDGTLRPIDRGQVMKDEPGRYLLVTDEFRKLRGFGVGDTFTLDSGLILSSKVNFIIVGVIWSPGLDVMLNTFDLPARVKEQTAATVFGTFAQGQETFGIRDAFLIAADLKEGVDKKSLLADMRATLGRSGLNVADVRQLKHDIEQTFRRILHFASTVAWLAMLTATLGVGNAIVAGIRTRQWRLGVLRAVGLTRAELLRLLLAEAVLLSLVGVALGVGFGLLLATNAKHLYSVALGFDPPLVLPWDLIGLAAVIVVVLGLLATIVPAALAARKEPLALLQAGRAAT